MKKMLSLILCTLMLLTLIPVTAVTAHADTGSINVKSIEYEGTQPVQLMEGFDMSVYVKNGADETGDEINIEYDQYALSKLNYKVTYEDLKDSGKVKTETLWGYEIAQRMQGDGLMTSGDHNGDTPWKAGEKYTAIVNAGGAKCEVRIEIIENPYESLRYLGTGAIPIVEGEDDFADGNGLYKTGACFEAKLKDGRTEQGTLDQIEKAAGNAEIAKYCTRDSSDWAVGKTYPVWFGCNGVGWSGNICISDKSSFTGLTYTASESEEPVRISPDDCYWDADGNLYYTLMLVEDLEFTVTLSAAGKEKYGLEGDTFKGTWDKITERFGVSLSEEDNLGENWKIDGTTVYYITMRIGDGHCSVPVVIEGEPVFDEPAKEFEYIKLKNPNEVLELIEGIDAERCENGVFYYNPLGVCNPVVTVKLTNEAKRYYGFDDDTLTLPWYQFYDQCYNAFADGSSPDKDSWRLRSDGVYICPVWIKNGTDHELILDVPVKLIPETQVKSVQPLGSAVELVTKVDSYVGYSESSNEFAVYHLQNAITEGRAKFRVTLNDGTMVEGTGAEIYEKLGYSGRLPLGDDMYEVQRTAPWNVGEAGHSLMVYFGKKSCTVPVTLSDPWVSSIELVNSTYLADIYDVDDDLFGEDVQLKLTLTAAGKTKFGKSTMTGTVVELQEALGGIGFNYYAEDSYAEKVGEEYKVTVSMGGCKTTLPVKIVEGTKVALTAANFPDANFRAYLEETYDKDGYVIAEAVTEINCQGWGIKDLTGIQLFPNLRDLNCSGNELTKLSINSANLRKLSCYGNKLTVLDVSDCPNLTYLDCDGNSVGTLDVSENLALEMLYCADNGLRTLDVSKNTSLTLLYCAYNELTALDVSKNTALIELNCGDNPLPTLDISKNLALETLYCDNNKLTTLNVSNNTRLEKLDCSYNQLTVIYLPGTKAETNVLSRIAASFAPATYTDETNTVALTELDCSGNYLSEIDASSCKNLEVLICMKNNKSLTVIVDQLDRVALTTIGTENVKVRDTTGIQSGTEVSGRILSADVAQMTLVNGSGKVVRTTWGVEGAYRFVAVPAGTYTLKLSDGINEKEYQVTISDTGVTGLPDNIPLAKLGDVNMDGVVDVYDLQRLYEHATQLNVLEGYYALTLADINGSGNAETNMQALFEQLTKTSKEGIDSAKTG